MDDRTGDTGGFITFEQASGQESSHIDQNSLEQPVHCRLVDPVIRLKSAAAEQGFDLRIASGYRSFDRQLAIWNHKATGVRPILGANGEVLNITQLTDTERVAAILRWSAVPGGSRHHWGSDIDVYDAAAVPEGYSLALTVAECEGMFLPLHQWLGEYLRENGSDWYRPFTGFGRGGVSPEPWHLSFVPIARKVERVVTQERLAALLEATDMGLQQALLNQFDAIYSRYIGAYFEG
jgi:D-alanyl-D-alanine carboxypeptidase